MMAAKDAEWSSGSMPSLSVGRLARLLMKLNDVHLRGVGITASQLPVLVALKNGERRTQMQLARFAGVEQPSMAQLLSRMERDGLVRREPAPGDRRRSLVSLTDIALQRLDPGREVLRSVDRTACAGLDEREQDLLIGLLDRMARNVEAAVQAECSSPAPRIDPGA